MSKKKDKYTWRKGNVKVKFKGGKEGDFTMPYTTNSANLPENVKALSDDKRARWVTIWNRVNSQCEAKDGDDCEGAAFRQANGVIFDEMALFTPPVMMGEQANQFTAQGIRLLVEANIASAPMLRWARKIARKLDKSEEIMVELMKTVAGKRRPKGDFLVVENPDEVSTWRLPVKVNGEVDRRLLGAAWASLHKGYRGQTYDGPDKAKAITKLKTLYKAQDMPTPAAEAVAEMHDDAMPMAYTAGPTSFTDLLTAQRANEAAGKVQELTYQFQMLVGNIMNNENVADKSAAIEQLALEFVDLVSLELDEAVEENEPETAAVSEVAISESAVGHVTRLIETGDVVAGGSKPLLLEITPIKPGWGNVRDNNYYPASMLERCFARAFDGVKMYETNHVDAETNNKNWVSTFIKTSTFVEGAPVGVVGIHDPTFAQKVLNLIELEKTTGEPLLSKLECSIRADGSATPGFEQDGRKGKRVQELSKGHSIDWVSRAGAGGHARRLLESEEEMTEGKDVKETVQAAVEPVEIAEKTVQAEPAKEKAQAEPVEEKTQVEPVTPQEVAPVYLSEQAVKALVPDHLPDALKARLLSRQFENEDEARRVITNEINYLMAVTNSGKPVMAEKQKAATPVVNVQELAEVQAARQSDVNKQFLGG